MKEPRHELLNREMQPEIRASVDRVTGMMDRVVNYGTHLLVKCDQAANQRQVLAVVMLGLHAVEALDAISVLLRRCSVDPAKVILRSEMEAMFGLTYMAQSDTERKSIQYLVCHSHARIDLYKRLDPTTDTGKQLSAELKKDSTFGELDIVALDTQASIANLESMLARPEYAAVEAEWQRLRSVQTGTIWWYNLFCGPRNVQGLAEAVNDHGFYQTLYRFYSGEMHATNALESLHTQPDMIHSAYQPLRYPTDLPTVAQLAVSMALRSYRSLIGMLVPEEIKPYAEWYTHQISPDYSTLHELRFVDPSRPTRTPPTRPKKS